MNTGSSCRPTVDIEQEIFQLEIAMHNFQVVQIFHCVAQLVRPKDALVLWNRPDALDIAQQVTLRGKFQYLNTNIE